MVATTTAAAATLRGWHPPDPAQSSLREAFLGFLAARLSDGCRRSCEPGHRTASVILFDSSGSCVLLTLHRMVGRWIQLGGHCEPGDETLPGAALREAREESGIPGLDLDPEPLHLDVHPITCSLGRPTRHFDVRFVARAPVGARPVISAESADLRWWPADALPSDTDTIPALVRLGRARLHATTASPTRP